MTSGIKKETIHAKGLDIGIYTYDFVNEYVSLTDIAKYRSSDPRITIHNWLRSRDVVDFLGLWEALHNRVLNVSISMRLNRMPVPMHSFSLLNAGRKNLVPSAC